MSQEIHTADSKSLFIPGEEEPNSCQTENTAHREHNSHKNTDVLRKNEERNGKQPEPEMTENVRHNEQEHRRCGTFYANTGRQFHNAIRLATHQSTRCGIVQGKP